MTHLFQIFVYIGQQLVRVLGIPSWQLTSQTLANHLMVGPPPNYFDLLVESLDGFAVPACGFIGYVSKWLEKTNFVRRQRTAQQLRNEKFS